MKKLKVMTIVGTRPEIIKLSRVIAVLERSMDHTLVHTGQNYDYQLNEVFFNDLEIKKPDFFLEVAKDNTAATIGNIITKVDEVLAQVQPEAVLFYGDTNSCLGALAAKRRQIPVFHMEAGNRCFDERVPEEINRRIIDHISDINLTLSEHARRYLIAEGIKPETVIKVGSCMQEILNYYAEKINTSDVLNQLKLQPNDFFILSFHREENVDNPVHLEKILTTLESLVTQYDKQLVVSTHPRTRQRLDALMQRSPREFNKKISFLPPFGFFDYIKLMQSAFCVVSDSGSITEDASLLNLPAVTIRQAHERPEGMDVGTLVMSGLETDRVLQAVALVISQHNAEQRQFAIVPDYAVENVSEKVARIILSYVDYINRTVWSK